MLKRLYWRWWKYKHFFEQPHGIANFGNQCHNSLIRELDPETEALKKKINSLESRQDELTKDQRALKKSTIIENDDYHSVRFNIRLYRAVALILLVTELGTNYFNALIIFGVDSVGLGWTLAKWGTAIALTAIGVLATDRFFEELLPAQKYKSKEPPAKRDIGMAIFWGLLLAGCEAVIYLFGFSRAVDVKGQGAEKMHETGVGTDLAIGIILLSMILPLIVGGVLRYIHVYRGAYQNRKNFDANQKNLAKVQGALELSDSDKYIQFQKLASAWWDTYNQFKAYKEAYDFKKGHEEKLKQHEYYEFLKSFDSFKAAPFKHFTEKLGDRLRDLPDKEFDKSSDDDVFFDEEAVQNA